MKKDISDLIVLTRLENSSDDYYQARIEEDKFIAYWLSIAWAPSGVCICICLKLTNSNYMVHSYSIDCDLTVKFCVFIDAFLAEKI